MVFGHSAALRFDPHAILKKMNGRPIEVLVELPPLIQGQMLGVDDIRHQFGALGLEQRAQFGGNILRRRLKRADPRKQVIRVKLALR